VSQPHRQCDELGPHMCPPCIHEQDTSCTSNHGNQVGWGSVIALAKSMNPRPIHWLGKYCSACQLVHAEAPLCWSAFVTLLTETHLPSHPSARLQTPCILHLSAVPQGEWSNSLAISYTTPYINGESLLEIRFHSTVYIHIRPQMRHPCIVYPIKVALSSVSK
jgi:hypothetical protein